MSDDLDYLILETEVERLQEENAALVKALEAAAVWLDKAYTENHPANRQIKSAIAASMTAEKGKP